MLEENKVKNFIADQRILDKEFEEYLKTLTDEEREELAESKSRRNGQIKLSAEEEKLFAEFIEIL